jgi:hypothetical protein
MLVGRGCWIMVAGCRILDNTYLPAADCQLPTLNPEL